MRQILPLRTEVISVFFAFADNIEAVEAVADQLTHVTERFARFESCGDLFGRPP